MVKTKQQLKYSGFIAWIVRKGHYLRDPRNWSGLFPLAVFLILAMPSGLYLVFNVPAMWAPDGGAHVARAFQIAEGGVRPVFINHEKGVGYGGSIPLNVNDLKNYELNIVSSDGTPGAERRTKLLTAQEKNAIAAITHQKISKQRILISYVNTAAYSPVAYLPNLIGIVAGTKLNLSLGHTLLLAGLTGFITYILCVAYSLFTLKHSQFKWAVMTVALLPLSVFQSTVITADSFLMSISILFSALIIKGLLTDSRLTLADQILLLASVLMLPLVKSVYFPLIFLILFIPKNKWPKRLYYKFWIGATLALSTIGFAIWSKLVADVAASNGLVRPDAVWKYGDAKIQEKFMLHHPFGFLHAVVDYFIYRGKFFTDTLFGWLGFTYLPIPGLAQVSGFLALGLSVLLAGKTKAKTLVTGSLAIALAIVSLLIFAVLYVAFTVPMNSLVDGVQGRYFLPLTVLLIVLVATTFPKLRISDIGIDTAKATLVILIAFCLISSVIRYGLAITV
jgi:uncharacterized membrane protein